MPKFVRIVLLWLTSATITALLASIFSTQMVIAGLADAGAQTGMADRLSMTAYDLLYFGKLYFVIIAFALSIAFLTAAVFSRKTSLPRTVLYVGAGIVAMLVMLLAMKYAFFRVQLVAGARDGLGLALQALAGGIGGYVFAKLTAVKSAEKSA